MQRIPESYVAFDIWDGKTVSGGSSFETTFEGANGTIITCIKTGHKIFMPKAKILRPESWDDKQEANTLIENPATDFPLIYATSTYAINTLYKKYSAESFITVTIKPKTSTGENTIQYSKKAIYHGVPLRGVAKMLHKAERATTGEVTTVLGD